MKKLFLFGAAFLLCSAIQAQEEIGAPYNPDVNADSLINLPDMLGVLPLFGQPFLPSEDDLDSTNEIQSLYLSGDTLYLIPNGGYILIQNLISSPSSEYTLQCVDMGIGLPCAPQGGLDTTAYPLASTDGYEYRLDRGCPTGFNADILAKPTWRKFRITGSSFNEGVQLKIRSEYNGGFGDPNNGDTYIATITDPIVTGNNLDFYVACSVDSDNIGMGTGILAPDDFGGSGFVWSSRSFISNGDVRLSNYEVWINLGSGFVDTGLRFNVYQ